jgi:hypothetical protein
MSKNTDTTSIDIFDEVLGDYRKTINTLHGEYLSKAAELEVVARTVVFPKTKQLFVSRLQRDKKYKKLEDFLMNCLTSDNKTSWLDHVAWVMTDTLTHHISEEYPSQHITSGIDSDTLRAHGYIIRDELLDTIGEFNSEIDDTGFSFSADVLEGVGVIILFLRTA